MVVDRLFPVSPVSFIALSQSYSLHVPLAHILPPCLWSLGGRRRKAESKGAGREEGGRRDEEGWRTGGEREEGWRRGGRRVKVGLRELEGRKLGQGRRE